ncbi:hypothetical protein ACJMK2_025179, partial [Sinanodonta woodiana]
KTLLHIVILWMDYAAGTKKLEMNFFCIGPGRITRERKIQQYQQRFMSFVQ